MSRPTRRVEVLHGVNLNMLGSRDPLHYGTLTLHELEAQIAAWGGELGIETSFFQTNTEGEYVERLQALTGGEVDGAILNPGSWTHYAYALHDALELTGVKAVEVHLSDVQSREMWRRRSVVGDLCLATFSGRGPEGYRLALERLRQEFDAGGEGSGGGG
jgi:3-dehydroquinate dehydratase II